jgi:hypothetical protein
MKDIEQTVAQVVRMEHDEKTDELFLVFQIVDEGFKRRIKKDWMEDVPLKIIGKNLVLKE